MIGRAREASSLLATWATIGTPSSSASSLLGPPIRRDHGTAIEDRRGTVDQQDVDPVTEHVADQRSELAGRVAAAFLEDEPAAECAQPSPGDFPGLVEDALLQSGKPGLDKADGERS